MISSLPSSPIRIRSAPPPDPNPPSLQLVAAFGASGAEFHTIERVDIGNVH
jgi:hypothetical protein